MQEFFTRLPGEVKGLALDVAREQAAVLKEERLMKVIKGLAIGGGLSISASVIALSFDKARHWAGENLGMYLGIDSFLLLTTFILMYRLKMQQNDKEDKAVGYESEDLDDDESPFVGSRHTLEWS